MGYARFRRRMRDVLLSLAVCLLYASVSSGDLAPLTYEGHTLTTKAYTDIQMQSEEVHIYIGQRCRVHATFVMQNETDKPIDLLVGFPTGDRGSEKEPVYDFRVRVNGEDHPRAVRQITPLNPYRVSRTWFGWDQTFAPGRTFIEVQYHIEPSPSSGEPWQNLYYILETGKYWLGTIAEALVTAHFEKPLGREQIRAATTPKGYEIDGNTVCWHFTNLEPTQQHNIQLEYMPFSIYHKLQQLRRRVEQDSGADAAVLELARHYLALGPAWCFRRAYLPLELTPETYQSVLSKTADPNDKAVFQDIYQSTSKQAREEALRNGASTLRKTRSDEEIIYAPVGPWRGVSVERVLDILGSADYMPGGRSEYVVQAKDLLERLLEKNPGNADAWMIYLSNYCRFRFGGRSPYHLDSRFLGCDQEKAIKRVYSQCPSHEGIKLWYESITRKAPDGRETPPTGSSSGWIMGMFVTTTDPALRLLIYCESMDVYRVQWEP